LKNDRRNRIKTNNRKIYKGSKRELDFISNAVVDVLVLVLLPKGHNSL